jgi:hypothetical protein
MPREVASKGVRRLPIPNPLSEATAPAITDTRKTNALNRECGMAHRIDLSLSMGWEIPHALSIGIGFGDGGPNPVEGYPIFLDNCEHILK